MNAFASPSSFKRGRLRAQRVRVSLDAAVTTMNAYQFPELIDISTGGAKVQGEPLPAKGTTALLKAGPMEVMCRVVWVRDRQCGLRFEELVPPNVLKLVQLQGAVAIEPIAIAGPAASDTSDNTPGYSEPAPFAPPNIVEE